MLTAKSDTVDVVLGLESGADDYVVKPFKPKELVARMRARLRHHEDDRQRDPTIGPPGLAGEIDVQAHQVARDGGQIALTPLEFDLLVALARKPRQVFTREVLLEQVWGYRHAADTRLVNVHVQRLRSKVERDPERPEVVLTVRGVGYKAGPAVTRASRPTALSGDRGLAPAGPRPEPRRPVRPATIGAAARPRLVPTGPGRSARDRRRPASRADLVASPGGTRCSCGSAPRPWWSPASWCVIVGIFLVDQVSGGVLQAKTRRRDRAGDIGLPRPQSVARRDPRRVLAERRTPPCSRCTPN